MQRWRWRCWGTGGIKAGASAGCCAGCCKQIMDVTVVGGGTSTALPWHGEPSNDRNKAATPQNDLYFHEYA